MTNQPYQSPEINEGEVRGTIQSIIDGLSPTANDLGMLDPEPSITVTGDYVDASGSTRDFKVAVSIDYGTKYQELIRTFGVRYAPDLIGKEVSIHYCNGKLKDINGIKGDSPQPSEREPHSNRWSSPFAMPEEVPNNPRNP